MTISATLAARREQAATASGGTSNDVIYKMVLAEVEVRDLRGALLDFGAGQGILVEQLRARGRFHSLTAVDLMARPATVAPSIGWIRADLNDRVPLRDGAVDVIVGAEVIEHLENPRAVAREWFRLLRPGGTVILTTPNNETWRSVGALLRRGHFAAFGEASYPAHITALVRKDLDRILVEAGFGAPTHRFTDLGMIPQTRFTWQAISMGRLRGLRYSDNLLASASKPTGRNTDE